MKKETAGNITHLLFVDGTDDSKTAKALCQKKIKNGLKIVQGEPALKPPRLVAPEGRFTSLAEIRKYCSER